MTIFGKRLRELRTQKDISLDKMAKDLGTTKATLSRYENGLRDPKTEVSNKFAEYFNCTVDYLLGNTNDPDTKILTDLSSEWIKAGIESLEVFKGLSAKDLTMEDLHDILNAIEKVKKRHE